MRWVYLLMLRRANERLDEAISSLPPGWHETPKEFEEEIVAQIRASNDVHYWLTKLEK